MTAYYEQAIPPWTYAGTILFDSLLVSFCHLCLQFLSLTLDSLGILALISLCAPLMQLLLSHRPLEILCDAVFYWHGFSMRADLRGIQEFQREIPEEVERERGQLYCSTLFLISFAITWTLDFSFLQRRSTLLIARNFGTEVPIHRNWLRKLLSRNSQ